MIHNPSLPVPMPRMTRDGKVELLLEHIERLRGRRMIEYEARLVLVIVDSIIAEAKEGDSNVLE